MNLILLYFISVAVISKVLAEQIYHNVSSSLNRFTLKLLTEIKKHSEPNANIVLSPYTVWSVLSVINEGAFGNTAKEFEQVLGIPSNNEEKVGFRTLQHDMVLNIAHKREGVSLDIANGIFTRKEAPLNTHFKDVATKIFKADVESLDFNNTSNAANYINEKISNATHGRIPKIVREGDVHNAKMYVTSALHFKGVWQKVFEKSATRIKPFYDESQVVIANVSMMEDIGAYAFASVLNEQATAIEIPYLGNMSMVVIMPTGNVSLTNVLHVIGENDTFGEILKTLKASLEHLHKSDVKLQIPKYSFSTDVILNKALHDMGIQDVFDNIHADLRGISDSDLNLSQMSHKANIEVDETGTEGAAATLAELVDKDGYIPIEAPVPFIINRPFIFVIFDKITEAMILAGTVYKPNAD